MEEVPATVLKKQEEKESVKIDQDINDVKENMVDVSIPAKMEPEDIQVPNEKNKGNSIVGFKKKRVLISSVKFWGRSYAMLGESTSRPKKRPNNKLRLNMKKTVESKIG